MPYGKCLCCVFRRYLAECQRCPLTVDGMEITFWPLIVLVILLVFSLAVRTLWFRRMRPRGARRPAMPPWTYPLEMLFIPVTCSVCDVMGVPMSSPYSLTARIPVLSWAMAVGSLILWLVVVYLVAAWSHNRITRPSPLGRLVLLLSVFLAVGTLFVVVSFGRELPRGTPRWCGSSSACAY